MAKALWWSYGGGLFFMSEVPLQAWSMARSPNRPLFSRVLSILSPFLRRRIGGGMEEDGHPYYLRRYRGTSLMINAPFLKATIL